MLPRAARKGPGKAGRRRGDEGRRPHPWRLLCAFQIEGCAAGRNAERQCSSRAKGRSPCARSKACRRVTRWRPTSISMSRPPPRQSPPNGCPVSALNSDLPRQSKKFRAVYDEGVKIARGHHRGLAGRGRHRRRPEKLAASVLSAMVGAVRCRVSISDKQLSDELLEIRARPASRAGSAFPKWRFHGPPSMSDTAESRRPFRPRTVARRFRARTPNIDGIAKTHGLPRHRTSKKVSSSSKAIPAAKSTIPSAPCMADMPPPCWIAPWDAPCIRASRRGRVTPRSELKVAYHRAMTDQERAGARRRKGDFARPPRRFRRRPLFDERRPPLRHRHHNLPGVRPMTAAFDTISAPRPASRLRAIPQPRLARRRCRCIGDSLQVSGGSHCPHPPSPPTTPM